jgi:hypothetical protein
MATFITEDGKRIAFIDWASVSNDRSVNSEHAQMELDASEECNPPCPPSIAANDLLDRNLLAFIQG